MSEQSLDLDQGPTNDPDMSCYLAFHLTDEDDLIFDAAWANPDALKKLAHVIYLIQNSDFIMQNIREMETENEEDIETLEKLIEELDNRPVILPLEVYRDE